MTHRLVQGTVTSKSSLACLFTGSLIAVTLGAMKVFRSTSWRPAAKLGKVYLIPMYKSFTEVSKAAHHHPPEDGMSIAITSGDLHTNSDRVGIHSSAT
ncbi:hypothetical protein J1614_005157 [Plenodomus biglobosus]|nr:hypothetical protein J1614_005157 [Plenodomus biglobosus]